MLEEFFESAFGVQELRDGPDGHLLEGFAQATDALHLLLRHLVIPLPEESVTGIAPITAAQSPSDCQRTRHRSGRSRPDRYR